MAMLQAFRKTLFWSLDILKGSKVKNHLRDVKNILENYDSVESRLRRSKILNNVLDHAATTTTYYGQFSNFKSLQDFPVINKNVIRDQYDNFRSKTFIDETNYQAYTSGSTGTPFKVFHDKNKKNRHSADVTYFNQKAGFEIGNRLFYVRHWDQYNTSTPWMVWRKNVHMHPVSLLKPTDIENLLSAMSSNPATKGILCYASVLDELKRYVDHNNHIPHIKRLNSIIAISETLKEDTKKSIETYFGVPVVSRYANVENGILAQQSLKSNEFDINWASYFVEILEMDSDTPAKFGEPGRIVITDLYNYCMPMIRYDTGDIGRMGPSSEKGMAYPVLTKVEGRKLDFVLNTKGEMISPYVVYHILKYPHIKQYQFIQEQEKMYRIKLNVLPEFDSSMKIISEFKKHLGAEAEILLEFVDDIPLLSSGKRKFVINKLHMSEAQERSRLQA